MLKMIKMIKKNIKLRSLSIVLLSFNSYMYFLRIKFYKKQERVCSLKDRLWGRVIYCINLIFLVSKIRKISSRVNLKIFQEKTDKSQFLFKIEGFLTLPRSFFGFWPRKKNLEHGLVSFGTLFVKEVLV